MNYSHQTESISMFRSCIGTAEKKLVFNECVLHLNKAENGKNK